MTIFGFDPFDHAVRAGDDVLDRVLNMGDAFADGDFPQVPSQRDGVDMIGVRTVIDDRRAAVDGPWRQIGLAEQFLYGIVAVFPFPAASLLALEPEMKQVQIVDPGSAYAEGVKIAVAITHPIIKPDAQFVAGVGAAHELGLVQLHLADELDQWRDRRLANADGPDLGRFNQRDPTPRRCEEAVQIGCRHPAGGAAADD